MAMVAESDMPGEDQATLASFVGKTSYSLQPNLLQKVVKAWDKGHTLRLWLRIQVVLYAIGVIAGVLVVIPLRITTSYFFTGKCLLYASVRWDNGTLHLHPGQYSACSFTTYMISIFVIAYGVIVMGFYIKSLRVYNKAYNIPSKRFDLVCSTINSVFDGMVAVMVLACAALITAGFMGWCDSLLQPGSPFSKCHEAQKHVKWADPLILSSSFFNSLTLSTTCAWICGIVWISITVASIRYTCLLRY